MSHGDTPERVDKASFREWVPDAGQDVRGYLNCSYLYNLIAKRFLAEGVPQWRQKEIWKSVRDAEIAVHWDEFARLVNVSYNAGLKMLQTLEESLRSEDPERYRDRSFVVGRALKEVRALVEERSLSDRVAESPPPLATVDAFGGSWREASEGRAGTRRPPRYFYRIPSSEERLRILRREPPTRAEAGLFIEQSIDGFDTWERVLEHLEGLSTFYRVQYHHDQERVGRMQLRATILSGVLSRFREQGSVEPFLGGPPDHADLQEIRNMEVEMGLTPESKIQRGPQANARTRKFKAIRDTLKKRHRFTSVDEVCKTALADEYPRGDPGDSGRNFLDDQIHKRLHVPEWRAWAGHPKERVRLLRAVAVGYCEVAERGDASLGALRDSVRARVNELRAQLGPDQLAHLEG